MTFFFSGNEQHLLMSVIRLYSLTSADLSPDSELWLLDNIDRDPPPGGDNLSHELRRAGSGALDTQSAGNPAARQWSGKGDHKDTKTVGTWQCIVDTRRWAMSDNSLVALD